MPIFEFTCNKCYVDFEEIVLKSDEIPVCPVCGSSDTKKLISASRHSSKGDSGTENTSSLSSRKSCAGCSGGNCSSC